MGAVDDRNGGSPPPPPVEERLPIPAAAGETFLEHTISTLKVAEEEFGDPLKGTCLAQTSLCCSMVYC